jgi:hypothetical protein
MATETTCITYFNQYTQSEPPVRQINLLGPTGANQVANAPCDTWNCSEQALEYECIGIKYSFNPNGTVSGARYSTLKELQDYWSSGGCVNLFQSMTTGLGTTSVSAFSRLGFQYVQDDFTFLLSRYFNQDATTEIYVPPIVVGKTSTIPLVPSSAVPTYPAIYPNTWIGGNYSLTTPGKPGYTPFLDVLLDACRQIPGACYPTQQNMCSQCSRTEIQENQAIQQFCGCVAPPTTQSDFYSNIIGNLAPACDPICNRSNTVKNVDPNTGYLLQCQANVCVIDNVIINSIDTQGVSPTFTQVCPSCANGTGNCLCIIDATFDNTVTSIQGTDGFPINTAARFTQYCPNSQCYENDPITGQFNAVPCTTTLTKKLVERSGLAGPPIKYPWWTLIVFAIILIIAIIGIIAYRYQADNVKVYEYIPGRKYKSI